jgi:hypothetical protein
MLATMLGTVVVRKEVKPPELVATALEAALDAAAVITEVAGCDATARRRGIVMLMT